MKFTYKIIRVIQRFQLKFFGILKQKSNIFLCLYCVVSHKTLCKTCHNYLCSLVDLLGFHMKLYKREHSKSKGEREINSNRMRSKKGGGGLLNISNLSPHPSSCIVSIHSFCPSIDNNRKHETQSRHSWNIPKLHVLEVERFVKVDQPIFKLVLSAVLNAAHRLGTVINAASYLVLKEHI